MPLPVGSVIAGALFKSVDEDNNGFVDFDGTGVVLYQAVILLSCLPLLLLPVPSLLTGFLKLVAIGDMKSTRVYGHIRDYQTEEINSQKGIKVPHCTPFPQLEVSHALIPLPPFSVSVYLLSASMPPYLHALLTQSPHTLLAPSHPYLSLPSLPPPLHPPPS